MGFKEKTVTELYKSTNLSQDYLTAMEHNNDFQEFEKLCESSFQTVEDREKEEKQKEELLGIYRTIVDVLKYYCDIKEEYYPIIAIWIIGTYYMENFPSYPYLFFNAMKGSGKSRIIRLITHLSKDGDMLNSLTEAVLFRTTGTLGIDEFEGASRKGNEALNELLNSAYKKGIKIKRMKKVKTLTGEEHKPEDFTVYRPIVMANINGINNVLEDRCITIVLEKSNNPKITKIMEMYDYDPKIQKIKAFPFKECSLCSVVSLWKVYKEWNEYVKNSTSTLTTLYTFTTLTTLTTPNTQKADDGIFEKIDKSGINGRNLEITLPLLLLSYKIDISIFEEILHTLSIIVSEKRKEDIAESMDITLMDYISQLPDSKMKQWSQIKEVLSNFKSFSQNNEEWINERWFGRALKRLGLIIEKKRMNYGMILLLDVNKAIEKMKMFRKDLE